MDQIKQKIHEWNIRRKIKRDLSPESAARVHARNAFLSEVREEFGTSHSKSFAWAKWTAVSVAIVTLLNGGIVVYADTKNVSAEHPLYPYKMLGEQIRLGLSGENRAELEAKLAERRLFELKRLEGRENATARRNQIEERLVQKVGLIEAEINERLKTADGIRGTSTVCARLDTLRNDSNITLGKPALDEIGRVYSHICGNIDSDDLQEVHETEIDEKIESNSTNTNVPGRRPVVHPAPPQRNNSQNNNASTGIDIDINRNNGINAEIDIGNNIEIDINVSGQNSSATDRDSARNNSNTKSENNNNTTPKPSKPAPEPEDQKSGKGPLKLKETIKNIINL